MLEFIIENFWVILIVIIAMIWDPRYGVFFIIGNMIFGSDNMVWLWVNFIIAILNIGTTTYKKVSTDEKQKEDKSKWIM